MRFSLWNENEFEFGKKNVRITTDITFDSLHRAYHVCLLDGRTPVVNFRISIARGIGLDLSVRLAFALCSRQKS